MIVRRMSLSACWDKVELKALIELSSRKATLEDGASVWSPILILVGTLTAPWQPSQLCVHHPVPEIVPAIVGAGCERYHMRAAWYHVQHLATISTNRTIQSEPKLPRPPCTIRHTRSSPNVIVFCAINVWQPFGSSQSRQSLYLVGGWHF